MYSLLLPVREEKDRHGSVLSVALLEKLRLKAWKGKADCIWIKPLMSQKTASVANLARISAGR